MEQNSTSVLTGDKSVLDQTFLFFILHFLGGNNLVFIGETHFNGGNLKKSLTPERFFMKIMKLKVKLSLTFLNRHI